MSPHSGAGSSVSGRPFIHEDFLLETDTARALYHDCAKLQPILDYHCHLPPEQIAKNHRFRSLTEIWLDGDHYKWRAMRSNGVAERLCTGDGSDWEKFQAWSNTVPHTLRNPLYHWTHLELAFPFGIRDRLLGPDTARGIFEECGEMLGRAGFRAQGLLSHFNVVAVCTTDDPADSLEHHIAHRDDTRAKTRLFPTWRPDRAIALENPDAYAGAHNDDDMMVVFDEASGIPDSIWSVAAGFFTENTPHRFWCAFSNPRRNSGYFFECFNAKRDFWETLNIDARTVEDTDKGVYEQIIAEYGEDSPQAMVEVYGEFPGADEYQFIPMRLVDEAMSRPAERDPEAPVVLGVDPARFGTDSTIIVARRGRELLEIRRFRGDDTMTVVGHVIEAIEDHRPTLVVVDEGGLGAGVLDRLTEQRYKMVRGVNFGWKAKNPVMYQNKRAELWGGMRQWLKTASLKPDRVLKKDLTGPRTRPDSSGAIALETKEQMKKRGLASPDAADALACTFAFPVYHREYNARAQTRTVSSYGGAMQSAGWMAH